MQALEFRGRDETVSEPFFRPFGARSRSTIYPRLVPWALFSRRFAAFLGPLLHFLLAPKVAPQSQDAHKR